VPPLRPRPPHTHIPSTMSHTHDAGSDPERYLVHISNPTVLHSKSFADCLIHNSWHTLAETEKLTPNQQRAKVVATHRYIYTQSFLCAHAYVYTHIYVCIYIYMYTYMYMYVFTNICVCLHTYIYTYVYIGIYTHIYVCIHVCMYIRIPSALAETETLTPLYVCVCVHICAYTHIYVCLYIYISYTPLRQRAQVVLHHGFRTWRKMLLRDMNHSLGT